jgi:hypothetical protein
MFMRRIHSSTDSRYQRAGIGLLDRPARSCCFGPALFCNLLIPKRCGFISLTLGACLPLALHAQSSTFDGTVALGSELVDRGRVIVGDTPVVQGAASWTFADEGAASAGWSLGLSGSTRARSPGRLVEALAQASHYWPLSGDWQMQGGLLYYRYPGHGRAKSVDRIETGVNWTYRDVLTFGLSAIYIVGGSGRQPRAAADLSFHWPLAPHLSLSAGAGFAESLAAPYGSYRHGYERHGAYAHESAYGSDSRPYGYGHAGLLWDYGTWRIELDRMVAGRRTRQQWASLGASPWVATISRSF